MENDGHSLTPLDWWHVGEASVFVLLAAIISFIMGTGLEISLIIASIRCVIQLTMMGYVLDDVLKADNVGVVILMSFTLVLLGAYEAAFNRARKTFNGMFVSMLCILLISNVFVGFIGSAFALQEKPFWKPTKFIPIIGMLLGNTMGTIAMATEQCLDNICVHAPLLEARLAFGASRYEAAKPLAINAIRVSVIPIITQLSVMGLINIPGMMTGQLMAGTPMMDAVIYQQCIMFMIAASSTLGAIMAVVTCLVVLIDSHHTLRFDRIHEQRSLIPRKLVLRAQAFLQRKLLELRHHTKTLAKTTRHRRWQRVRTEEEIELE